MAAKVVAADEQHHERYAVRDAKRTMRFVEDGERERHRQCREEHEEENSEGRAKIAQRE